MTKRIDLSGRVPFSGQNPAPQFEQNFYHQNLAVVNGGSIFKRDVAATIKTMTIQVLQNCDLQIFEGGMAVSNLLTLGRLMVWSVPSRYVATTSRLTLYISTGTARVATIYQPGIHPEGLINHEDRIYNGSGDLIVLGILPTANGGTGQNLSATGGATSFLAQDAAHIVSVRPLILADLPVGAVTNANLIADFFLSTGILSPWGVTTSISTVWTSLTQQVRASRFSLSAYVPINKVTFVVTTAQAGSKVALGIYSLDGLTKLVDSGEIDTSTIGVKTVTLGATVTLPPGEYWLAYGSFNPSTAACSCNGLALGAGPASFINTNSTKTGIAAGAYGTGTGLPAVLGAVTASGTFQVPAIMFET